MAHTQGQRTARNQTGWSGILSSMPQRLKTIFILGAGASRQGGAPLMADFIDKARDLFRAGNVGRHEEAFRTFFDALGDAQVIHSKSRLDTNNIEAVFSAFEFAQIIKSFCGYEMRRISTLPEAAKGLIAQTIEETLLFPIVNSSLRPPKPYDDFGALVTSLQESEHIAHDVVIITFNYDCAVDFAFWNSPSGIYYGLEPQQDAVALPIFKLHGSLNWAMCAECPAIALMTFADFMQNRRYPSDARSAKLNFSDSLAELRHGSHRVKPRPVLVPPTWNKAGYHQALSVIWSAAAAELASADNIFVIGYSLSETDIFFRYLYALGTVGRKPLERFWVYDPDTTGTVKSRFLGMLGPGAEQRFTHRPLTFENAIPDIASTFGIHKKL